MHTIDSTLRAVSRGGKKFGALCFYMENWHLDFHQFLDLLGTAHVLLPQHFQQEARHVEYEVDMRLRATGPHAWGFFELTLDEGLLAVGRIGVSRASGILPDGT